MSTHETPIIRAYWRKIGGTLIEEYPVVRSSETTGPRRVDAIILPKGAKRIAKPAEISLTGEDVIVVQAKAGRLGMHLMGQTLFSAQLVKRFRPASVRSVALCLKGDEVLRPMLEKYAGMQVVVMPHSRSAQGMPARKKRTKVPS